MNPAFNKSGRFFWSGLSQVLVEIPTETGTENPKGLAKKDAEKQETMQRFSQEDSMTYNIMATYPLWITISFCFCARHRV